MKKIAIANFLKYYLLAILWAGVIFYFSSIPDLSAGGSSVFTEIVMRKAAHFVEYSILAWLIWRVIRRDEEKPLGKVFLLSVLAVAVFALSDEIHQALVPGRSGKILDVVYDILSATAFLWIVAAITDPTYLFRKVALLAVTLLALLGVEMNMIEEGEIVASGGKKDGAVTRIEDKIKESASSISGDDKTKENSGEAGSSGNERAIPKSIKIKVPFTSQAPFANWDPLHEEACEEASVIMVKYFLDGKSLDKETAEREIQGIVDFQKKKYGFFEDSDASQTAKMAKEYYGMDLKVVYDVKKEDIKKYLAEGKPVIIPAAGQMLGNPNFTAPGPPYHALVLVGYNGDTIITNDPGTRKGEGYKYDIDTLYDAIHDFPGSKDRILEGRKAIIIPI